MKWAVSLQICRYERVSFRVDFVSTTIGGARSRGVLRKAVQVGIWNDVLKPADHRPASEETLSYVSTGGWPMYSFLVVMLWI